MKILLENWKKFLKENEFSEKDLCGRVLDISTGWILPSGKIEIINTQNNYSNLGDTKSVNIQDHESSIIYFLEKYFPIYVKEMPHDADPIEYVIYEQNWIRVVNIFNYEGKNPNDYNPQTWDILYNTIKKAILNCEASRSINSERDIFFYTYGDNYVQAKSPQEFLKKLLSITKESSEEELTPEKILQIVNNTEPDKKQLILNNMNKFILLSLKNHNVTFKDFFNIKKTYITSLYNKNIDFARAKHYFNLYGENLFLQNISKESAINIIQGLMKLDFTDKDENNKNNLIFILNLWEKFKIKEIAIQLFEFVKDKIKLFKTPAYIINPFFIEIIPFLEPQQLEFLKNYKNKNIQQLIQSNVK